MPHWHPSRWLRSRRPPQEQEYQGFPLYQRLQGGIQRLTASHRPIITNTASDLSAPMLSESAQRAIVIARLLQSQMEHEFNVLPESVGERIDNIDILGRDLRYLDERGEDTVPEQERARVEQLVENRQFFSWLNSQESGHLLIHGHYDEASHISGLSLWCRSLTNGLAQRSARFIPLVFFCGLHTRQSSYTNTTLPSYDDTQLWCDVDIGPPSYEDDIRSPIYNALLVPSTGGHTLIRSFIYQLLCHLAPDRPIPMKVRELLGIERGNLITLYELFSRLVGILPRDVAVYCLVDGAEYYEQEAESWGSARWVLRKLVLLSSRRTNGASVHLLITTPTFTSHISEWFRSRRILSMEEIGRGEDMGPDSTTLQGEMGDVIEQGQQYSNSLDPRYSAVGSW